MWLELCERHPEFRDPESVVKLRARGLKALIDQAYDEGRRSIAERAQCPTELEQIFGKFRR
jgi:hypothetical protein